MTIRVNADAGKPLLQMEDERGTTADCVPLAASRAIFKCTVKPAENGDVPVADGGIAVYTAFEVQHNFINVFTVYGVREKDTVDAPGRKRIWKTAALMSGVCAGADLPHIMNG